ncbi:hypothetical protein CHLNCDRAFT_132911 [Chlorella variabilis]|uniref:Uncharacterized protein n=1 Tax=Chlorella variabilis TaxID=554065 RepID=E1Z1X6_CHLVA|nr:hypothetical protein CHLNCDRAFT_132911 [Chlorella variabilis]EFN59893.1 hypothetical protein CHLNCDRAFT_132911 [Chlorella variabilis]|eukprot:XP_005851995.1 hypothetical protein CHLNCDRAFT_132911 [Chlorella variabilis]
MLEVASAGGMGEWMHHSQPRVELHLPSPPLPSLRDLETSFVHVSEAQLAAIMQHTQLTRLRLEYAGLKALPQQLRGMANLRCLELCSQLRLPKGFANLKGLHLTRLQITDTNLAKLPPALSSLTDLVQLILTENEQLAHGWEHLANLPRLETLSLGGSYSLNPGLPASLTTFASLRHLSLRLTPHLVRSLWPLAPRLAHLTSLDIMVADMEELPHAITHLSRLQSLDLRHNHLLACGWQRLSALRQLTALELEGCTHAPADLHLLLPMAQLTL